MATDEDLEREGKNLLLVAGMKALTAFLDGKAFFQIETEATETFPRGRKPRGGGAASG